MASPFKSCATAAAEEEITKLNLETIAFLAEDDDGVALAKSIASGMSPTNIPGHILNFIDPNSPDTRTLNELRKLLPAGSDLLSMATASALMNAWNAINKNDMAFSLYLYDGEQWRQTPRGPHMKEARRIFVRLIEGRWSGYAPREVLPTPVEDVAETIPAPPEQVDQQEDAPPEQDAQQNDAPPQRSEAEVHVRQIYFIDDEDPLPEWIYAQHPELGKTEADDDAEVPIIDFSKPEEEVEVAIPDPHRIRKASEQIQASDKLVVLNDFKPDTPEYQQTRRCFDCAASITVRFGDDDTQGPIPDEAQKAGLLDFYVELLGLAPTLVLEFKFTAEGTHPTEARCRLEFAFNQVNVITGTETKELTSRREIYDFDMNSEDHEAIITFKSQGARSHDVLAYTEFKNHRRQVIPQSRLKQEQKWVLNTFKRIATLGQDQSCTIKLKLLEGYQAADDKSKKKKTLLQQLAELLPSKRLGKTSPPFEGRAYATYRNKQGNLALQYNQMVSRKTALRAPHPGAPIPKRQLFRDNEEAALFLCVGQDLLAKEQAMYLNTITEVQHMCTVLEAGNFAVVSCKFTKPLASGIPDLKDEEKIMIPSDTMVKLTISAGHRDKRVWHAVGTVAADVFGWGSDLLVIVTNKDSSEFSAIITKHDSAPRPTPLSVWITPIINDMTTKLSIDAVNSAFTVANKPDNPNYVPAMLKWPLLYQGERLAPEMVFTPDEKFRQAFNHMMSSVSWDREQRAILQKVPAPPAGILLTEGVAGTGKSLMMNKITEMALSCEFKVVYCGNLNDSLDSTLLDLDKLLKEGPSGIKPLRAYSGRGENILVPPVERTGPTDDQDKYISTLYATWRAMEETFQKKRHAMAEYSVTARVLENLDDANKPPLMAQYTNGVDENKNPIPDGEKCDMHAELRKYHALLKQESHANIHDEEAWPPEELRRLRQCIKFNRYEVYQESQVMLCTNAMSGIREVAEFASGENDKVILITDEATTISEALEYISLNTRWSHKICAIYKFGDTRQLGPISIAATSKGRTVNEFIDQQSVSWFERLLYLGFDCNRLVNQKRQHKLLHEPVNQLHYGYANQTTQPKQLADLADEDKNILIDILGLSRVEEHDELTRRYAHVIVTDSELSQPDGSNSSENKPHVSWLMQKERLDVLKTRFGTQTQHKALIQVPYRAQLNAYNAAIFERSKEWGWSRNMFPAVKTIDSGIGGQAFIVINDFVRDKSLGFLKERKRDCVAGSRAIDIQLNITGSLEEADREEHKVLTQFVDKSKSNHHYKVRGPITHHEAYARDNNVIYWFSSKDKVPQKPVEEEKSEESAETDGNADWDTAGNPKSVNTSLPGIVFLQQQAAETDVQQTTETDVQQTTETSDQQDAAVEKPKNYSYLDGLWGKVMVYDSTLVPSTDDNNGDNGQGLGFEEDSADTAFGAQQPPVDTAFDAEQPSAGAWGSAVGTGWDTEQTTTGQPSEDEQDAQRASAQLWNELDTQDDTQDNLDLEYNNPVEPSVPSINATVSEEENEEEDEDDHSAGDIHVETAVGEYDE